MITQEIARLIFNAYSEIESGKKMIEELKKAINEQGEFELKEDWTGNKRHLELRIPSGSGSGSYSIRQVPIQLGLDTIKAHILKQEAELVKLKTVCETQLA